MTGGLRLAGIKSACLALLALSVVVSAVPVPVLAVSQPEGKRATGRHVAQVEGDGSCDEPAERVVFVGHLVDPSSAFVADPEGDEDDDEQGDQIASASVAIDSDVIQRHDPPGSRGVVFFDVVVRGKKTLLAVFSRAGPSGDDVVAEEEPHASLLLQSPRTSAAAAGFDVVSGRRPAGLNPPTATDRLSPVRPSFLRSVAPVASTPGNRPESRGPASAAPRSTPREDAWPAPPDFSPRAAVAARPWVSPTAEAPAAAPSTRCRIAQ